MLDKGKGGASVFKIAAYGTAVFLIAVFQSSVAPRFPFFGTTPVYLLALTAAAAFFDGESTGSIVGLASGFVADALGGVGISVLPVFYTLLGWGIGRFVSKLGHNRSTAIAEKLGRWALWLAASCGVGMIITFICLLLSAGKVHILAAFAKLVLPEAIGTFLFGYPIGIIFIFIYRKRIDRYE